MIIKRWLRWTLTSLVAIILILLLVLGWLITSQSGLQLIISRLLLPSIPELSIDNYDGRLIGALTLRGIHYKNKAIEVTIKDLNLDWHPSKLFSTTIAIDTFKASNIKVVQIAPPSVPLESKAPSLSIEEIFNQLKLPVDININSIEVTNSSFSAYQSDEAIKIQRFALIGSMSKNLLSIKEIELKSDFVDLQGNMNLSLEKHNRSKDDIDGQLSWAIKAPATKNQRIKTVYGETILLGKIDNIKINNSLAAPYDSSIDVTINDLFNNLNISSDIKLNNIQVSDINAEWPNYQIKGALNITGNMDVISAVSNFKIEELNKNLIINTKIKSNWKDNQLTIDALTDIPGILEQLQLKGSIQSKLDNIDGKLSWVVKAPDIKTVYIETILLGKTDNIKINNSLAAPYDSSIDLSINDLFNNLNISSDITLNNIQVSDINAEWPNYQIKGALNITGNMDIANAVSNFEIKELDKNIFINTKIKSDWKDNLLTADVLLDIPGILEQLQLKANVEPKLLAIEDSQAIALSLKWKGLNIPDTVKKTEKNAYVTKGNNTHTTNNKASNIKLFSPEGKLSISGNLKNYLFSLDTLFNADLQKQQLALTQKKLTQGALVLNGFGNTEKITLENIALSGPIGMLNGHGSINFQPELIVALDLSGKNINPEIISTDWPGDLSLDVAINTTTSPNGSPLIKTIIDASGDLRSHPFALNTVAELIVDKNKNHSFTIENLLINSGSSKISSAGIFEANKTLSAKWSISSNNLEELIPNTKGKIQTRGTVDVGMPLPSTSSIRELLHAIKTELTLSASGIEAFDTTIEALTVTADINWQEKNNRGNLTVDSKKLSLDSFDIESLSARLDGEPENHQLIVDIDSRKGNIDLLMSGQLNNKYVAPQWRFSVESANIDIPKLEPWHLQNTMSGMLSENNQFINNHCWLSDLGNSDNKASICLEATNKDNLSTAKFTLSELSAEYFSAFIPKELSWSDSIINGQGNISLITDQVSSSQQVDADIKLFTTAGKINWQTSPIQDDLKAPNDNTLKKSIQLEAGTFYITSDKKEIKVLLKLPIEKQTGIDVSLTISNKNSVFIERDIQGELKLAFDNIEPFHFFIPDISNSKDLKGSLDSQLRIGGSIAKPWIDGQLALSKGQILLNSPGILLEDITLTLKIDKQSGIEYQASLNSGGGILRSEGKMALPDNEQAPKLNLSLKGERVKVFDTEEALVFASPDITVTTNSDSININGSITIPEANITPKKIPASVVSSTEDQIIVDAEKNQPLEQTQKNIAANVDIILGENVKIDGFGFKGTTTGSLNIIKQPQGPVLGNGEIKIVDGEYRAFGQGLIIDRGLILFTGGPVAKPGIDIKALRRPAEDIIVGIYARGSLSQPNLTIFSEPSMPQAEQLSWLVLGRPLEQTSEGEGNAISQLLLSLSLSGGNSVISSLSETFNLDTLSLQSGSGEAGSASSNDVAELVLGKYLSPELYVSYGIGLFKPVNVLSLEYSLSRYWKLTSETSEETSGGDIVYTIEK